jgi:hypothetical protein
MLDRTLAAPGEIERMLETILQFVLDHPHQKELFIAIFTDMFFLKHDVPDYLLVFCMETLRYPEIAQLATKALNHEILEDRFWRSERFWTRILAIYETS